MSQRPVAAHTDSIEGQDPAHEPPKKAKSRRPANTAFRQQRLKAWQPILTPKTVLPLFFVIGVIFAPVGGLLLYASSQVREIVIDYSDCGTLAPLRNATDPPEFKPIPSEKISSSFKPSNCTPPHVAQWQRHYEEGFKYGSDKSKSTAICTLQFVIPEDIGPPVLFYYRLTNFYQNHRRYVISYDAKQLKGEAVPLSSLATCAPLTSENGTNKPYYPCGLIANSLFNDTFKDLVALNPKNTNEHNKTYPMTNKGISWSSDKDLYGQTKYKPEEIAVPPNWADRWPNGYTNDQPPPKLAEDEELQVWMRSAGLPAFSKLAKRNDHDVMECGMYEVEVELNFPVTIYGGTKSIIISTRTVMGGKNPFLGIAYVVVGGICIVLGALFTVAHLIKPRKLGDHTYLTWDNDQPSTATATGIQRPDAA